MAFHPSRPGEWLLCGWNYIAKSVDSGAACTVQYLDDSRYDTLWNFILYDDESPTAVFVLGAGANCLSLFCSYDGDASWSLPVEFASGRLIFDVQQSDGQLLVYAADAVYEISKQALKSQSPTAIRHARRARLTPAATFDLQGRRQPAPLQPQLYIQSGKKFIQP